MSYFLEIEVGYTDSGISLTQKKFTRELLSEAGITEYKNVVIPLPINLKLTAEGGDIYSDASYYRCMVGKLNFLTHTRPDSAFTIQHLSRYLQQPRITH